ncbi:MAG: hypothetical protein U9Q99_02280 [Nanoarchaeota archaeon]|nr:hypothetical protein [Nanoarchaeota archaeon]
MVKVKIKKIHPNAKIPFYANKDDAERDIYAVSKRKTKKYIEY